MCDGILVELEPLPIREGYIIGTRPTKRMGLHIGTAHRRPIAHCLHDDLLYTQPFVVDVNDAATQLAGLKKRLMRAQPVVDDALVAKLKLFVARKVKELDPISDVPDFEAWLERGPWSLGQKENLRMVWHNALMSHWKIKHGIRRKLGRVKPFIKRECYSEVKHARFINAANDKFKVLSGPWFHAIEDVVFSIIGKTIKSKSGKVMFIKHYPVTDRATLVQGLRELGNRFLGTDFTSLEASFTPEIMVALEIQLYDHMLQHFPGVAGLLKSVLAGIRKGTTRQGVFFSRPAGRMSGDACTSLGNGFSNLMLFLFWAEEMGVTLEGFVEGDDGIFATNYTGELDAVVQFMRRLGFDLKDMQESDDPCTLSFCGVVCAKPGEIIREPVHAIEKFGWFLAESMTPSYKTKILRSKALSFIYEMPHCPLLRALADWALSQTGRGQISNVVLSYNLRIAGVTSRTILDHMAGPQATSGDTRMLFSRLYGIDPAAQVIIEEQFRRGDFQAIPDLEQRKGGVAFAQRMLCRSLLR